MPKPLGAGGADMLLAVLVAKTAVCCTTAPAAPPMMHGSHPARGMWPNGFCNPDSVAGASRGVPCEGSFSGAAWTVPSRSPLLRARVTLDCAALARAACALTIRRDSSVCRPCSETMNNGCCWPGFPGWSEPDPRPPGSDMRRESWSALA